MIKKSNIFYLMLLILIILLDIVDFKDSWMQFIVFKSQSQIGEIVSQGSEILALFFISIAILFKNNKKLFLIGSICGLLGNSFNLIIDIKNKFLTFNNISLRISLIIFYIGLIILILTYKKTSKVFKILIINLSFLIGFLGILMTSLNEIKSSIFDNNLINIHSMYGASLTILFILSWIYLNFRCRHK
ncbi:hypothetical protein [Clostridium oceanicum]|uniref:Uncharacterized protein n=1 Tax=Clostridium oceanicum TaxID=1543 RepID=A0ABP3UIB1_9CLOT